MSELILDKELERIIEERFNVKENLEDFNVVPHEISYMESPVNSRLFERKGKLNGRDNYVFLFFAEKANYSPDNVMERFIYVFRMKGLDVEKRFIDYENRIAGFSWRR